MAFATPEDAARAGIPASYVRVVGVVVRGDDAIVAQVMNADGYPVAYEIETAWCVRERDGWTCGSSGNGNVSIIPTSETTGTMVSWQEAPPGATGASYRLDDRERMVPVKDGFALVAFDDVPLSYMRFPGSLPSVERWLHE
jgi:hypothetical protein